MSVQVIPATAGHNITVGGSALASLISADFDSATPAAPAGGVNCTFAKDALDPTNISVHLAAGDVSNSVIRDGAALTLMGRSANSSGEIADIAAAAASGAVLRESGSTIGFGTIATAGIANNAVLYSKWQQLAGFSIAARAVTGTGDAADLTAGTNSVLGRVAGDLSFAQVATAQIADDAVTFSQLLHATAESKIMGRVEGSGAGPFGELVIGSGLDLSGDTLSATGGSGALNDLSDVTISTPSTGQFIRKSASDWVNVDIVEADISDLQSYLLDITSEPIGDLSDVTITAIASDEILKWNGSTWINNTLAEAGISAVGHTHLEADITDLQSYLLDITSEPLSDLSDVTITAIAANEIIKWTGSAWINNTLAEAGISATGHTHTQSEITDLTKTIIVDDEGSPVAGGPHSTLDFVGAGVTVTDGTGGVATITIPSGGGGDTVTINGVSLSGTDVDFDDATPAAPAGSKNVVWAKDTSDPDNVSASVEIASVKESINQTTHGFSVADVLRHNGTSFTESQADTAANSNAVGVVESVADANNFVIVYSGRINITSGFTAGVTHYLSTSTAGLLTTTDPGADAISNPILVALTVNDAIVTNQRGIQVNSGGAGAGQEQVVVLASPVATTSTSYVDITGLSFSVEANGIYEFECRLPYNVPNITDAIFFATNGPASPTYILGESQAGDLSSFFDEYDDTDIDYGPDSEIAGDNYGQMQGVFSNGANAGTLSMRFKSDVGNTTTILAGAVMKFRKLN